ncbi:TetR/AcrR family transcriptional regulator [Pseudonocardia sp. TRM90224]|uniref:TetR/AcrR family transcriptional regulator n=1 Tax=Pseudonocardia sp. TRM90224 TaxID=2812678 RepID=UPI001E47A6C8|nr:TetR/AcrR family transcriptional regulator [Pseudonocardia sp. TRM90224]
MTENRRLTFTEEARRRQIVDCTIGLMSERGHAGTSLSAIAAAAGISKAAVLYHFTSKDKVIEAALAHVLDAYVAAVSQQVEAAPDAEGMIVAYIGAAMRHLGEHPTHVRVIVEVLANTGAAAPGTTGATQRWQAVASMIDLGKEAGRFRDVDSRVMALAIGGALDGVVAEWIADPTFDLDAAATELQTAVLLALRAG